ncbi:Zinc finger, CCHC-type [Trema orientale]|uniref:Zinc finger, CCHC-type n=1 Tax=Trema orientale TaxID=63057 RepID=A0A2P5EE16_TREOI|nr:Zinc finger, CCHC-type [Trema orientale]
MRVWVKINITKPLQRELRCFIEETQDVVSLLFLYEWLPEFCFFCGTIGHRVRDCSKCDDDNRSSGGGVKFRFGLWLKASNPGSKVWLESDQDMVRRNTSRNYNPRRQVSILSSSVRGSLLREDSPAHIGEMREIEEEMVLYSVSTVEDLAKRKDLEFNQQHSISPVLVSKSSTGLFDADRGKILRGADMVLVSNDENFSLIQAQVGEASIETGVKGKSVIKSLPELEVGGGGSELDLRKGIESDPVIDTLAVEQASSSALLIDTLGATHSAHSSIIFGASENLVKVMVDEDQVLANSTRCFAIKSKSNRRKVAPRRKNKKFSPKGKCSDSMNKSPIRSFPASGLRVGRSSFLSPRKKTFSPKKPDTQMEIGSSPNFVSGSKRRLFEEEVVIMSGGKKQKCDVVMAGSHSIMTSPGS